MDIYVCVDSDNKVLEVFNNADAAINSWLWSCQDKVMQFKDIAYSHDINVYANEEFVGKILFKYLYTRATHL